IGDDYDIVRSGDGIAEALLDASGRVNQREVELASELFTQRSHLLRRNGVLLARLWRRDQIQAVETLVPDHRLAQFAGALDDIDEVIDDAILQTEDDIEVAQTDIGIDQHYRTPERRQRRADVRRRGRFPHPAFS